jgi:hypothetical protein
MKIVYILSIFLFFIQAISVAQNNTPLVPYRINNVWGYSDTNGNIKIKPIYSSVQCWDNGFALVKLNNAPAVIGNKGSYIIPPGLVDSIEPIKRLFKNTMFKIWRKGQQGILDINGKTIIGTFYNSIELLHSNVAKITRLRQQGFMNIETGDRILSTTYDSVLYITGSMVFYKAWRRGKAAYFKYNEGDVAMKSIPEADAIRAIANATMPPQETIVGIPPVSITVPEDNSEQIKKLKEYIQASEVYRVNGNEDYFIVKVQQKQGLVYKTAYRNNFDIIAPFEYDSIAFLFNSRGNTQISKTSSHMPGSFYTYLNTNNPYFIVASKNGKYGIVDNRKKTILPFVYDAIQPIPNDDYRFILTQQGKKGIFMFENYVQYHTIACQYDAIALKEKIPLGWYTNAKNDNDSFSIYEVMVNSKSGYIGQNGVAYFK